MPGGGGIDLNPVNIVKNIIHDPLPTIGGIAGGIFGGPLGAAIGSGGLSLAEGKPVGQSLINAGISGLGTFAAGELFGGGAEGAAGGAEAAPWVNPDTGLTVGQAGLTSAGGAPLGTGAAASSGIPALSGAGANVPDLTIPSQAFGGEAFIPGASETASAGLSGLPEQAFGGEAFLPGATSGVSGAAGGGSGAGLSGAPLSGVSEPFGGENFLPSAAGGGANTYQLQSGQLQFDPNTGLPMQWQGGAGTSGGQSVASGVPLATGQGVPTIGSPNTLPITNVGTLPATPAAPPAAGSVLPAASTAAGGAAQGGWFNNMLTKVGLDPTQGAGQFLSENKNLILPGLALGGAALTQMGGPSKNEKELQRLAQQFRDQGASLSNYLQTGTLPPGAQAGLDQATASAKAAIRSKYASMNMSGSSSEQAELRAVDQGAAFQAFQYADQLLKTGVQESGLAGNLYNFLLQHGDAQDQSLQESIANFAAAAAGGGGGNSGRNISLRLG